MHSATVTVSEGGSGAVPEPRSRIGRYAIEGVLGTGGMAVVYLARDPVLDRAVALKVLQLDGGEASARRLVREGQALARVSHPNVIAVYEVGRERDGLIYIAMERIAGVTLARWLESPRARHDILAVFAAAGRGLSAAHAAGLVHRDFKPENVMVGDDGRVCVLDFGLARESPELDAVEAVEAAETDDAAETNDAGAGGGGRSQRGTALAVTAIGGVAGTPAYMSPEQWRGERAGVRSDQFSFCVALWRALTGEHPFDTSTREALRESVIAGQIAPPPPGLPRRLRAVLQRGLAMDPRARFASIDEIVHDLAHDLGGDVVGGRRGRRARPWLTPAVIASTAVAAVVPYLVVGSASSNASHPAPAALYAAPVPITSRGDVARSSVSPDRERIALLTADSLIVQRLQPGAAERVLLRGRPSFHTLSWSPDGRQLALVAAVAGSDEPPGLVVVDVETGALRRIGDNLGGVVLLGSGELVAARFNDRALSFYAFADTSAPVRRCPLPGSTSGIRSVRLDPASDALYVQIDDTDRRSSVLRIDRACRRIDVVADLLPILSFAVRPGDGRLLARLMGIHHLTEIGDDARSSLGQHVIQSNEYVPLAIRSDGAVVHIDRSVRWSLDVIGPGGARRALAGGAAESRFSVAPDGRLAQVDGLYDAGLLRIGWLDDLDGETPATNRAAAMTTIADHVARAAWSPDGHRLAVLSQSDAGYRLAIWNAATGAMSPARPLPVPYDVELTWLDDHRVAYPVLPERVRFDIVDTTGASDAGALTTGLDRIAVSLVRAHGDPRLAFVTDEPRALAVWMMREGEAPRVVARVPVASPAPHVAHVAWAADDRSLIVHDATTTELWTVTVDGQVALLPGGAPSRGGALTRVTDVIARPDRLLMTTIAASSDVYLSPRLRPQE